MSPRRRGVARLSLAWQRLVAWCVPPRWRRPVKAGLALLAVGAIGGLVYLELLEKGYVRYNKWDRRVRGTLRVGDPAPDVELTRYDGTPLRLSSLWETKPVVLVFGSCT